MDITTIVTKLRMFKAPLAIVLAGALIGFFTGNYMFALVATLVLGLAVYTLLYKPEWIEFIKNLLDPSPELTDEEKEKIKDNLQAKIDKLKEKIEEYETKKQGETDNHDQ